MDPKKIADATVAWYLVNARDLPWRRKPYCDDPYCVYVSEIMLQQTQVKTVIPYWERWMRELPTVQALAQAAPERVLKLWEGLGYYSRARNLQKAARLVVEDYAGRFPEAFAQILELPGVGRYTAGAIASIAFNQPTPIVDGNVARVLTRYFGIRGDIKSKATNARLWSEAQQLVAAAKDCSALNQGLMELGATVCRAAAPACGSCPVRRGCYARRERCAHELPEMGARVKAEARVFRAELFRRNGDILLRVRPNGSVNGGFWEMPNIEVKKRAKRGVLCRVKHTITRFRMTLEVVDGDGLPEGTWVAAEELDKIPIVNAHRKALGKLGIMGGSGKKAG